MTLVSELTQEQIDDIGSRLLAAITAGDADAVREVYSPEARIWHNFDEHEQNVAENLMTLADMHRRTSGLDYTEIRRFPAPGGFVQQHVLVADAKYGPMRLPAIIRFWVEDGRITRVEEYLDTRQARVLYKA